MRKDEGVLLMFVQTSAGDWNIVQLTLVFTLNLKTERELEFSNENLVINSSGIFASLPFGFLNTTL